MMTFLTPSKAVGFALGATLYLTSIHGLVGDWSSSYRMPLNNGSLIIVTILDEPFMFLKSTNAKHNSEHASMRGTLLDPSMVDGYFADLIAHICQERMKIPYKFLVETRYGRHIGEGVWDGIMGALINRQADLAAAALTINAARIKAVDFTQPVIRSSVSIMMKKPHKHPLTIFSIFAPLSIEVWLCLLLCFMLISVILFIIDRLSLDTTRLDVENEVARNHKSTLCSAPCLPFCGLLHRSIARSISGRFVVIVWCLFCLIVFSMYVMVLSRMYLFETMTTPHIRSFDELARQTAIHYGVVNGGSTMAFFNHSGLATVKTMWNFMTRHANKSFVASTREGIERVRQSRGRFAFLLESTRNDYTNSRYPCDTIRVGEDINSQAYGIATPVGSPLREMINTAVLELNENGFLIQLKQKWFDGKIECSREIEQNWRDVRSLNLENTSPIFHLLLIAVLVAVLLILIEFFFKARHLSRQSNQSLGKVIGDQFRQATKVPRVEH